MADEHTFVSLEGPVDLVDGELKLIIPLSVAGDLVECAGRIGEVRGDDLVISIPGWLALLSIAEGSEVIVDNQNGKFNIRKKLVN